MKDPDIPRSGKRGGIVWQRNRYGQISHALVIPANPRTPEQVSVREVWSAVNARWPMLAQAQRECWGEESRTKRSKPRLQQSGPLTGYLLFMKINVALGCWGKEQVDLPPKYPRFPRRAISGFAVTNVASVIKLGLVCRGDPGDHTIIRVSLPRSERCKVCTDFRGLCLCPPPVEGIVDITALYTAKFGVPPVGSKIFVRVNQIIDGWQDEPEEFTAIVPPRG
jgi:hypothetical protein